MTNNELILKDRLEKIKSTIEQYGEDNFSLSFSGGKDSTVLSWLIDKALPNNTIPRVYCDTGIELNMVKDFVKKQAETDKRIVIIKPKIPIAKMLKKEGYPFKSKRHSKHLNLFQRKGKTLTVKKYLGEIVDGKQYSGRHLCPKKLKYQFNNDFNLKISDKCCNEIKKEPLEKWAKENKKPYRIIGVMRAEGGLREGAKCLAFVGGELKAFQPLVAVNKEWEDWLINEYKIDICDIYKPPYNMQRTGCKGCPFNLKLQDDLNMLSWYFPNERKQCEAIWKPVYDEYRRIGYRLLTR